MKKIFSIFVSLLFLFSTINLNVVSHYCGGRLVETKLITGNGSASCGMEDDPALCENYPGTAWSKNCCEDDWHQIAIKDDYTAAGNHKVQPDKSQVVALSSLPRVIGSQVAAACFITARYKSPPGSHAVFLPFIQVFLV
ncbi:MAG TPA: hypothetical protein VNJ07_13470 [Chitinophagales bacterium]|nr:hypothetical protein [Chitinophagales bacterium]